MRKTPLPIISVKFGGTSMGSAAAMLQCARIVSQLRQEGSAVVATASAVVGVTNMLIEAIELALGNKRRKLDTLLVSLKDKHIKVYNDLSVQLTDDEYVRLTESNMLSVLDRLETILKGVMLVGDISDQSRALVISMGEKISSHLFLLSLHAVGVKSVRIQAEKIIKTDGNYLEANVNMPATIAACRKVLLPFLKEDMTPVVTGFIGKDPHGGTTLLGRGGSDYTAAILGVALKAHHIELRKDVAGVLSANPRTINDTRQWAEVDMSLMSELCYSGAEIVNPKTISLAQKHLVPILVKSTFDEQAPGTQVAFRETRNVRSLVLDRDCALVHIENPDILNQVGFIARVTGIVQKHQIPIDVCTTSETSFSFSLRGKDLTQKLITELESFGDTKIIRGLIKVCLVGHGISQDYKLLSDIFSLAQQQKITLKALSIGASEKNITFLLDNNHLAEWVQLVHTRLFKS